MKAAKQLAVIAALLLVMLGLEQLRAGTGTPLTLAAIGFVVLASFTFAELGSSLTLPKVTGYILAGIALGPYAGQIFSAEVVKDMRMFNDLALGLIATSAGLELDGKAIVRMWKGLTATVALKVVLLPLLVGGTFVTIQSIWAPLDLPSFDAALGMAIIFSALAVGTSPAIALAVLSETGAKGKLSDLTLGLSVLKDAVVVVCLAVAIAVALSLTSPDASLEPALLLDVGMHLGEEVLLGIGLALLLVAYMRFVGAEMLLFVAAMILVVTHVTTALHLQPLLTFIVAGFIVRNFTPYEHTLLHPLEIVALPVFVVFFTNAGASVDLGATLAILPLALALCAARAVAFYVAGRFGAAAGGESPVVQRASWMAYLPQAGVTLGLVGIAANELPDLAVPIQSTGMAVVALNLLVGPITLRLALRRAGELPGSTSATAKVTGDATAAADVGLPDRPSTGDADIDHQLDQLEDALRAHVDGFVTDVLENWSRARAEALAEALPDVDQQTASLSALRRWADAPAEPDAGQRALRTAELFETLRTELRDLPIEYDAPLPAHLLEGQAGDGPWLRLRKQVARVPLLASRGQPRRRVMLRMAARTAIEPELAPVLRESLDTWLRTEATLYADVRQLVEGNRSVAEVRGGAAGLLQQWIPQWREGVDRALRQGMIQLARWASEAGTILLSDRNLRFSRVEPSVTKNLAELERTGRQWTPRLIAARRTVLLVVEIEALQRHTNAELAKGFLEPLATMLDVIVPEVRLTRERLAEVGARLAAADALNPEVLEEAAAGCRKAFSQESHRTLKQRRAKFRDAVVETRLTEALQATVGGLPEDLAALGGATPLQFVRSPLDTELIQVPLRRICEEALLVDFSHLLGERVRQAHALVNVINSQLREHVGVATFAIELARSGEEEGDLQALVDDGSTRALRRVDELLEKLVLARDGTPAQLSDGLARTFTAIRASAARARVEVAERRTLLYVTRRSIERTVDRVTASVGRLRKRGRALWRRLRASDLSTELQRRAGRTRLDAVELRARLHDELRAPDQPELPPMYGRLFSLEPLHDRRLFATARAELKQLLAAEHKAMEGQEHGGVLVVGAHGSGRTSLLNVAQSEFRAPRVLRLGDEHEHRGGLLAALASELQCEPRPGEVRATLADERTAIVVDDLESWCSPDVVGIRDLSVILDLIVGTRHVAFWAVSISEDALALVDPAVAVRQAFGRVISLAPLDAEALCRVVEARNRVSGLAIEYPRGRWASLLGQRRIEVSRSHYYRNLQRTSAGNLRAALRAWHRDIEPLSDDAIRPQTRSHVLHRSRFLDQLHPHAVGLVVQVVRFGATDVETLARTLALSRAEVGRHVAFLRAAGILETRPGLQGGLRLAPAVQPTVSDALVEFGASVRRDG